MTAMTEVKTFSQTKKTIQELSSADLEGKRVIVRVDFNVPLQNGVITDETRIRAALKTLLFLTERGAKVILISHLGRPKSGATEDLRLAPVAKRLRELMPCKVHYAKDVLGPEVDQQRSDLQNGEILLLENVRFHAEETANDEAFAQKISSYGDLFIQEAFGTCHRAHASTVGIAKFLPSYAGFLFQKEIDVLEKVLNFPHKPLVAIIGGAKVSSKINVLISLLQQVDTLIIGGGMAFTFLKAQGYEVGKSLWEPDRVQDALAILEKAKSLGKTILLPSDQVVVSEFKADAPSDCVSSDHIPADKMGMDIGPKTVEEIKKALNGAHTIFWNGPLGVFEMDAFSKGTCAVAEAVAESKGMTIVGGGDTGAAIAKAGVSDKIGYISTGGGASLEFLEGIELPGVSILENK